MVALSDISSVQYLFLYLLPKFLKKHIRSSSYLVLVFFKENSHSHEKFTKRLFQIFQTDIFQNPQFLSEDRKINKIYQQKLKSDIRLWALEISYWKLRLYSKLFCLIQTLHLSHFDRVSLANLCVLLINIFEKLPLINSTPKKA